MTRMKKITPTYSGELAVALRLLGFASPSILNRNSPESVISPPCLKLVWTARCGRNCVKTAMSLLGSSKYCLMLIGLSRPWLGEGLEKAETKPNIQGDIRSRLCA